MRLIGELTQVSTELVSAIAYRVGLGSIASTVGLLAAAEKGLIELTNSFTWSGMALIISMAVGVLSVIKLRYDIKKSKLELKLIQIKIDAESEE